MRDSNLFRETHIIFCNIYKTGLQSTHISLPNTVNGPIDSRSSNTPTDSSNVFNADKSIVFSNTSSMGGAGGLVVEGGLVNPTTVGDRVLKDPSVSVGIGDEGAGAGGSVLLLIGGSVNTGSVVSGASTVPPVGDSVFISPIVTVGKGDKGAGAGGSVLLLIGGFVNTGSVVSGASTVPPPPLGWYVSIVSGTGGFVVTGTVGVGTGYDGGMEYTN